MTPATLPTKLLISTLLTPTKFTSDTAGHSAQPALISGQKSTLACAVASPQGAPRSVASSRLNARVLIAAPSVWSSANLAAVFGRERGGGIEEVFGEELAEGG